MSKKLFSIFLTIFLIISSFLFTNNIINLSRKKDPIMMELINYEHNYNDNVQEAVLVANNIIPGIKGKRINIDKSYSNMKKIGKFEKTMLVFDEALPANSLEGNYQNFIISGNKSKNNVSIVMEVVDTSYIEEILNILNNKNIRITFFIDKDVFDNSIDIVKLISSFGHDIELLSSTYTIYEVNKYNSIIKLTTRDNLSYCYSYASNEKLLKSCKDSKLYTIIPTIKVDNYLYNTVKNNLENGAIISIKNNNTSFRELKSTIDYIHQKGKKIVLLKKLLSE